MKSIRVDPVARTARAEPGVLWGEFDRETQAFGLPPPAASISSDRHRRAHSRRRPGLASSKHGFTIDNLLSVDVVTAEGNFLTARASENEELFWAMRGAGHNFGVATSFEYRLHPVGSVLGGMTVHPFDRATNVLRFYREFAADLQTS